MDKLFEKIAQEAYEDELSNIYENPDEYEFEGESEEEPTYYGSSNPAVPLTIGGLTGASLMAGLGALKNRFAGSALSSGLSRNAIIGGLLGLTGASVPLLIDRLKSKNESNEEIAAEPLQSMVFGE